MFNNCTYRKNYFRWIWILSISLSLLNLTWGADDQVTTPSYQVGWQWEYQHTGPRPGSYESTAIDGNRIRLVTSLEEEADEKTWIFQEWFTNSSEPAADYYVNQENLLTSISFKNNDGEEFKINYLFPIPYQITNLNIGEKKEFKSEMQFDSAEFSLPTTLVYERLEDQSLTTPAGEFSNCQHYVINITSLFDIKIAQIPAIEVREVWYHPNVNGMVKEVYRKSPIKYLFWSMEGYTSESELISFSQDAPMMDFTPTQSINDEIQHPVNNGNPQKNNYLLVMVFIIILITVGVYFILKLIKQKQPHHSQ